MARLYPLHKIIKRGSTILYPSTGLFSHFRLISKLVVISLVLAGCAPLSSQNDPANSWLSWFSATPPPAVTMTPVQTQTNSKTPQASTQVASGQKATSTPVKVHLTLVKAADLKGVKITLLHPWTGAAATGLQSLVDEFNRKNEWGIQVNVAMVGSQSEVAVWMTDALSSPRPTPTTPGLGEAQKELPDLVAAGPVDAQTWQNDNPIFESVQDYAANPTWGLTSTESGDLLATQWPGAGGGSLISAAPAQRSLLFMFYNQSWAKSLGFSKPPATPEEFRNQACKAAKANQYDPDPLRRGTGGWLVSTDPSSILGWIQAFEGKVGPDSTGRYTFNTPAVTQAFTFLKSLENQNCAWIGRDPTPYDYFASREAIFYLGTLDDLSAQRAAMQKVAQPDQWTAIAYPAVEGKPLVVAADTNFYLVKSNPARQMAAWLFIRWMENSEQQARWMKVSNTVPLGKSVQAILGGYRIENPQWAAAFDLEPLAVQPPGTASWSVISGVLGDGADQILQPDTPLSSIPTILAQMDQTAAELIDRKAP